MKVRGLVLATCLSPLTACAEVPEPIFDAHLHASSPSPFGGKQVICTSRSNVTFPPIDPLETATPQKAAICDTPLWSVATEEENIERTTEIMKRRNIYGLLDPGGSTPEQGFETFERWSQSAPSRFLPSMDFFDAGFPPLEDIRRWVEDGKIEAFFEISVQYNGLLPTDERLMPYYALAEELDIPVAIHMGEGPPGGGQVMLGSPYEVALGNPILLEPILRKFPKLRVVAVHAGSPYTDEMLGLLYSYPQLYVDMAQNNWGFPRAHFHAWLKRFVDAGFSQRILFGSDQLIWPDTIEIAIESIEQAPFLSEAEKRDILYNNAARFFRFSEETIERHKRGE